MPRSQPEPRDQQRKVSLVTLGCARNEVDSEELAGRLAAGGWTLTSDDDASVVLVNTCGFIESAKQESISELLAERPPGARVVAVGCLAERYGSVLAAELPEAQVLSFDDYDDIADRLDAVAAGQRLPVREPRDRRRLLPLAPAGRPGAGASTPPGHARPVIGGGIPDLPPGSAPASGPRPVRRRLAGGPAAPLKIASGCDRRCSFCAIPSFRGAFLSRPPQDVIAEARWLAAEGVREVFLVSENSTSYGKDLGNLRLLEELLPELAAVPGIERVRVSYLQPAEVRPGLIQVMAATPGVAPYFDLSFQHASGRVLRSMRRFGDGDRFLALVEQIREACPGAGIRSNFIVGFPGETPADLAGLERFLAAARLDAIGIFGYSDEEGTEAVSLPGKLDAAEIARRADDLSGIAEEVMSQRAADRIGEVADVLVEEPGGGGCATGRAAHQAPDVDGTTMIRPSPGPAPQAPAAGDLVRARITGSDGADLLAEALATGGRGAARPAGC